MGAYGINIPINTPGADKLDAILASIGRVEAAILSSAGAWGKQTAAIGGATVAMGANTTAASSNTTAVTANTAAVSNLGSAHGKLVTDVQAASGAIRAFEGHMSIRAVEQFSTKILGLGGAFQAIFPAVGAVMFIEVLGQMVSKIGDLYNSWNPVIAAEQHALTVAEDLTKQYEKIFQKAEQIRYSRIGIERGPDAERAAKAFDKRGEAAMNEGAIMDLRSKLRVQEDIVKKNTFDSMTMGPNFVRPEGLAAQIKAQSIREQIAGMEFQQRTNLQDAALEDLKTKDAQRKKAEAEAKRIESERNSIINKVGSLADTAAMAGMTPMGRIDFRERKALAELAGGAMAGDAGLQQSIQQSYAQERSIERAKLLKSMGLREGPGGTIMLSEDRAAIPELFDGGVGSNALEGKAFERAMKRQMSEDEKNNRQLEQAATRMDRSDATSVMQQFGKASRRAELMAGPGGEGQASIAAYNQRIELAQKLFDIDMRRADRTLDAEEKIKIQADATFEKRKEEGQALIDLEIKKLEMVKQQREEFQGFISGLVSASFGGGNSVQQFMRSQGQSIVTKMASNATGMMFPAGAPGILGGLTGTSDNPTMIGKLLSGTLLGPKASDPLKAATDLNTAATNLNTQVIAAASGQSVTIASGSTSVGGSIGSILGGASGPAGMIFNALGAPSLFNPSSKGFPMGAFMGLGGPSGSITSESGAWSGSTGVSDSSGDLTGIPIVGGGTRFSPDMAPQSKTLGYLGAAIGAGLGAYQISKGGAQNVLGGAGGLMGSAASIMSLAGVGGPAAPIIAGVGMALGVGAMIMGDPKKRRSDEESRRLKFNQFVSPEALNISEDVGGGFSDYDKYGNVRTSSLSPFPQVEQPYFDYRHNTTVPGRTLSPFGGDTTVVNINAMDAGSFQDFLVNNPNALSTGVVNALNTGGNNLMPTIRDGM